MPWSHGCSIHRAVCMATPFHSGCLRLLENTDVYITIPNSRNMTVINYQLNNSVVRSHRSMRSCSKESRPFTLVFEIRLGRRTTSPASRVSVPNWMRGTLRQDCVVPVCLSVEDHFIFQRNEPDRAWARRALGEGSQSESVYVSEDDRSDKWW